MKILKSIVTLLLFSSPIWGEVTEFQQLMGRTTKHWMYVTKPQDMAILQRFEILYEKNKTLGVCLTDQKIPRVFHFIWLGPDLFPSEFVENVKMWVTLHPDWQFKFWVDCEQEPPCRAMEVCTITDFPLRFLSKQCLETMQKQEIADALRFAILYEQGGIFVGNDTNCLKNFSTLIQYDFFCGLETPHPPLIGRNITCGSEVIGARPSHPVIGRVIELINEQSEDCCDKPGGVRGYCHTHLSMEKTYMKLTHALTEQLDQEGNNDIVLPAAYFFAKEGIAPLYSKNDRAQSLETGNTYQEKQVPSSMRALNKLQKKNSWLLWLGRSALSLNLLTFSGLLYYVVKKKKQKK